LLVYHLQVLRREYTNAADVWSAGVIMYILLSGYPPFGGKSDSRILQKVQQGSYSFANREVRHNASRNWLWPVPAASTLLYADLSSSHITAAAGNLLTSPAWDACQKWLRTVQLMHPI
jgi:serine/threonine protein kinase